MPGTRPQVRPARQARQSAGRASSGRSGERQQNLTPPFRVMSHIMNEQLRRLTVALRPIGISGPIWRVLSELEHYGPANISDLARRSALDRSNVSRLVDRLIKAGLAESADHADKRVHLVRLSAEGFSKYHAAAKVVAPLNQATISVFSPDELDQLNRLLERLAIVFGAARD